MKKNIHTPLTDEYLKSLEGIQPAEAGEWFYARLRGRMRQTEPDGRSFRLRPALVIGMLAGLLVLNGWMISELRQASPAAGSLPATAQDFAQEYNLSIQSNY